MKGYPLNNKRYSPKKNADITFYIKVKYLIFLQSYIFCIKKEEKHIPKNIYDIMGKNKQQISRRVPHYISKIYFMPLIKFIAFLARPYQRF